MPTRTCFLTAAAVLPLAALPDDARGQYCQEVQPATRCAGAVAPTSTDPDCVASCKLCVRPDHEAAIIDHGVGQTVVFLDHVIPNREEGAGTAQDTVTYTLDREDQATFTGEIRVGPGPWFQSIRTLWDKVGYSPENDLDESNSFPAGIPECQIGHYDGSFGAVRDRIAEVQSDYIAIYDATYSYTRWYGMSHMCTYTGFDYDWVGYGEAYELYVIVSSAKSRIKAFVRDGDPSYQISFTPCPDCEPSGGQPTDPGGSGGG